VTTVPKIDGRFAPKFQKKSKRIHSQYAAGRFRRDGWSMKLGGGNKFSSSARPGSEAKIQKMPPSGFVRRLTAQFTSRIHPSSVPPLKWTRRLTKNSPRGTCLGEEPTTTGLALRMVSSYQDTKI
jgi:hypothetical protein